MTALQCQSEAVITMATLSLTRCHTLFAWALPVSGSSNNRHDHGFKFTVTLEDSECVLQAGNVSLSALERFGCNTNFQHTQQTSTDSSAPPPLLPDVHGSHVLCSHVQAHSMHGAGIGTTHCQCCLRSRHVSNSDLVCVICIQDLADAAHDDGTMPKPEPQPTSGP